MPDQPRHTNRLINETSPYLLQHAHNPVDWYPWGEEALAKAKADDRPILLSVGYSACHWCHVMERESFEDEEIASLMNEQFVAVKVDREERPDLDEIYMAATQVLNRGQGGWPMTVFLTPDRKPFFAGTYFPPRGGHGRPGFRDLLTRIAAAWKDERAAICEQSGRLTEALASGAEPEQPGSIGMEELEAAARQLADDFDEHWGGFGPAPKFPPSGALDLLLRHHHRSGDANALAMVEKTLSAMAHGGIYDQIGGGFARYSTDERWLVPHFEKMLYDNALLARCYLAAFQATGAALYERVAREVLDYLLAEMRSPEGGFYSATDADSEGVEGKFFVWTPAEVANVVGSEAAAHFCDYFGIVEGGNFEGKSIPNVSESLEEVAARHSLSPEELDASLARSRAALYQRRRERVPPGLDDKVLTAWNALAIGALAEGSWVLDEPSYLAAAEAATSFLRNHMVRDGGRLYRTYRQGRAHLDGVLEDYAYLGDALLDLYEAGGDVANAELARTLADQITERFSDSRDGSFFTTADDHEQLIVRLKSNQDGATPSPIAIAARVLARLSYLFDGADYRAAAARALRSHGRLVRRFPRAFCRALGVADLMLSSPVELAFVGDDRALRRAVGRRYLPNRVVAHRRAEEPGATAIPLLQGKALVDSKAALYVCRDYTCQAPITDAAELEGALRSHRDSAPTGGSDDLTNLLAGKASPAGTKRLAERSSSGAFGYSRLGRSRLQVSRVGFGGYRIGEDSQDHGAALAGALRRGCNVIDTASNYNGGGSEIVVGEVLAQCIGEGVVARDEVVVVSKLGYVQGPHLDEAKKRKQEDRPLPEMVEFMENCWHSVHPDYLAEQLTLSLRRLQLATLDVCLLHNPEYFFADAAARGDGDIDALRDEFYRRLETAFVHLESEVKKGRIGWYGVSSNNAGSATSDSDSTSVARMLEAAQRAGGDDHHFTLLQLPLNLLETDALDADNTQGGDGRRALDFAAQHDVGVLANRPLNAFYGSRLVRLADVDEVPDVPQLESALEQVAEIETALVRDLSGLLKTPDGSEFPMADLFNLASELRQLAPRLESHVHWQQVAGGAISPRLGQTMQAMGQLPEHIAQAWTRHRDGYIAAVDKALDALDGIARQRSRRTSAHLREALLPQLPETHRQATLSQAAFWAVASTPGIACVLVGMRRPAYVEDAAAVLDWEPLADVETCYAAARQWAEQLDKNGS